MFWSADVRIDTDLSEDIKMYIDDMYNGGNTSGVFECYFGGFLVWGVGINSPRQYFVYYCCVLRCCGCYRFCVVANVIPDGSVEDNTYWLQTKG